MVLACTVDGVHVGSAWGEFDLYDLSMRCLTDTEEMTYGSIVNANAVGRKDEERLNTFLLLFVMNYRRCVQFHCVRVYAWWMCLSRYEHDVY